MKTSLKIQLREVFDEASTHINYIADKFSEDWDKVSMIPESVDFTGLPNADVFNRVVNLMADYIEYDKSADISDTTITLPLDMPDNWPTTEAKVLEKALVQLLAHNIEYEWLSTCNLQLAQKLQQDCDNDTNRVYDSLSRRMRPRREVINEDWQNATIEFE